MLVLGLRIAFKYHFTTKQTMIHETPLPKNLQPSLNAINPRTQLDAVQECVIIAYYIS